MEWTEHAACVKADSNLFFDDEPMLAKRICYQCTSRQDCLLFAANHDLYGVWGGYTKAERDRMTLRTSIADGQIQINYEDL